MNSLEEVYVNCPLGWSDKGHSHGYLGAYGDLLAPMQHQPITVCELGIQGGASVVLWDRYFTHPDTKIIGIDVDLNIIDPANKGRFSKRVQLVECNSNDLGTSILKNTKFDFALDDGSHMLGDQIRAAKFFLSRMLPNSIYIIEDLCLADWNHPEFFPVIDIANDPGVRPLLDLDPSSKFVDCRGSKPSYGGPGNVFHNSVFVYFRR
jgi:hypothetical protein